MVVPSPPAPAPPSVLQPSRRTVVGAGLIAVPAVTMLSAAPAYAAASDARTFTITTPSGTVPANGQVIVTVRVLAPNGTPLTARPISLVGPSGSTFTPADGVTNGAGTFTTRFRLNKLWAAPGSSTVITAVSESGSGSATFTVLGANMLIQQGTLSTQTVTQFSSSIVRAQNGPGIELVLLQDGTLWRRNTGSNNPYTQVAGISDGADLAVSSGSGGTFYVLKKDGTVWAWGANEGGQVGDGTTANRSTPVQAQISGVTKISAANGTLFAVTSDKLLWAVGYNNFGGMAGIGAASGPIPFTQVSDGTDVVDVVGRQGGGVLVKTDGTVWAWGQGSSGYNGDGTTADQPAPAQVNNLHNITSLAGGMTATGGLDWTLFAISDTGAVYVWGSNARGAYGNNTTTASPTPVQISGTSGVAQITTSNNGDVYALKNDGTLLAWGGGASTPTPYTASRPVARLGNANNEGSTAARAYLITATTTLSVEVLQPVDTPAGVAAGTAAVVGATVATESSGVAGANVTLTTNVGTLAATSGTTNSSGVFQTTVTPDAWTTPGTVARVTAADETGTSFDTFTVLGANMIMENGGATQAPRQFSSPIVRAQTSPYDELVLLQDGTLWTRARGSNGPYTQVAGISDGADLAVAVLEAFYVLKKDGTVWAWGNNLYGQLGDGTTTDRQTPAPVLNLSGVTKISAGNGALFALKSDRTLWAVGGNGGSGACGVGSTTLVIPLTQVVNGTDVVDVAGKEGGGLLVKTDGTVWVWGRGAYGYNGDGTTTDHLVPVQLTTLANISSVTSSVSGASSPSYTMFAISSSGTVHAWGYNGGGAYGNNTTTSSLTPIQISGLSGVTQITTSSNSRVLALRGDRTVLTWGGGASTPNPYTTARPITRLGNPDRDIYNFIGRCYIITE
ncbi:hypothetical protein IFU40_10115 [Microbacterium sp. CFBP 13617]|uniref:hypothetical protein n=1 Tax=Microbacterium sp. CFBP 13617 TaxID=2774035 RepID=UPI00177E41A1|nr:hypothetical protein [Microbacterium sp. CFBP 13617]MBD8218985.1 hypothetical protein [Microbacterium sp. CFBP 13617]